MLILRKTHTGRAGFETGTHAWLARQSGVLAIAPRPLDGGPRVVVGTAAFHARVRGSFPGLKETKCFFPIHV